MTAGRITEPGIARPGSAAYQAATRVFNLAAPPQPAVAVTARTVDQVRAALRYAHTGRLPVRVHTTGHAAAAARPVRDALLIRTELSGNVEIDSGRRLARVPAGTQWGAVVAAAAAAGLAAPHGSSPTVGVIGYLLRGGLSWYGRKVGLAVNQVRAVELVTMDGDLRRVDAASDPELFWALRGGGGGFGVVTGLEFELFPATEVVTGAMFWPAAHADRLLRAWLQWAAEAPWEVTTSWRVMNLPPLPEVPRELSAGPVVSVDGAVLGTARGGPGLAERQASDLLDKLRSLADPVWDTWQLTSPSEVLHAHLDPTEPVAVIGDHMLLDELGEEGAARLLQVIGEDSGSPLVVAGLRQLGGAYAVRHPAGGALDHLEARYSYAGSGVPAEPVTAGMLTRHCAVVRDALRPWNTGRTVPSFVERFTQPQRHLGPEQVRVLDRIRQRVDPAGLFRGDIAPHASLLR
jgi:FAD/FMN-containing dehydrogenase